MKSVHIRNFSGPNFPALGLSSSVNFYCCKLISSDFNQIYNNYGFIILKIVLKQLSEFLEVISTDILNTKNVFLYHFLMIGETLKYGSGKVLITQSN